MSRSVARIQIHTGLEWVLGSRHAGGKSTVMHAAVSREGGHRSCAPRFCIEIPRAMPSEFGLEGGSLRIETSSAFRCRVIRPCRQISIPFLNISMYLPTYLPPICTPISTYGLSILYTYVSLTLNHSPFLLPSSALRELLTSESGESNFQRLKLKFK